MTLEEKVNKADAYKVHFNEAERLFQWFKETGDPVAKSFSVSMAPAKKRVNSKSKDTDDPPKESPKKNLKG
eukprot:10351511-Alexandrium_andersonii.AAC.1